MGLAFLRDLSEFFLAFEGLFDSFRRTASAMEATLRDESTDFILVTTPLGSRVLEAGDFAEGLRARSLRASAIVVNRVHPWAMDPRFDAAIARKRPRSSVFTDAVWRELTDLAQREESRAASDRKHFEALAAASRVPVVRVPEFDADVHDIRGLERIAAWLYREEEAA